MADDAEIDYGPLTALIGSWQGDKGMDVAPEPDGKEESPYFETITFTPIGDVTNAEQQVLVGLRYHQTVSRKANNKVFHDQVGYWMWDKADGTISHSLLIPRAVGVMAGGVAKPADGGGTTFEVKAGLHNPDWTIVQQPFMRDKAKTVAFNAKFTVNGDTLVYTETTVLDIYGKKFQHTDGNTLSRVA